MWKSIWDRESFKQSILVIISFRQTPKGSSIFKHDPFPQVETYFFFGVLYCCLDQYGTHYVSQADFELMAILLPQPVKYWDYRHELPHPVKNVLFIVKSKLN